MPNPLKTIMPAVYCQADEGWIQEQLLRFSPSARHRIVALYADVYQQAWDSEPVSFRQENRARHEANTRLRRFVTHHAQAAAGLTEKPPLSKAHTSVEWLMVWLVTAGGKLRRECWMAGNSDLGNVFLASEAKAKFAQAKTGEKVNGRSRLRARA